MVKLWKTNEFEIYMIKTIMVFGYFTYSGFVMNILQLHEYECIIEILDKTF